MDCVKIDGVFVRNITEDPSSFAMVKSIVEIAHLMDKQVVAEFVEDEATLVSLQELDVDFAQGRAIGEPIPLRKVLPPQ
ncbi:MAG: EAL domain-containing protein [Candidatus Sedimenticola endophacoides]